MMVFLRRHAFLLLALIIFALALFARAGTLKNYVTPDEPAWVLRSLNFSQALARGDWAATAQMGHPGVTTMWLGALGIMVKRAVDPVASTAAINWLNGLTSLAPENAEAFKRLGVFLTFARLPVIVINALGVVVALWLLRRLFDQRVAAIAGLLLALDPFVAGLGGLLHVDGLLATFSLLSVLVLLIGIRDQGSGIRWFALSGAFAALALLSKSPALFLLPFIPLVIVVAVFTKRLTPKRAVLGLLSFVIVHLSLFMALYPAMWVDAAGTFNSLLGLAVFLSANPVRPTFFEGQYVLNHGPEFYPTALIYRLTPVVMVGIIIALIAGAFATQRRIQETGVRNQKAEGRARSFILSLASRLLSSGSCIPLLAFSLLFIVFITPVAKKYDRYLLPAFVMLIPIAAWGYGQIRSRWAAPIVSVAAAAISLAYWPYLLMHYNLLLGGPAAAQQHFAVGWGEGLGAAANWINAQPSGLQSAAATAAVPSFAPLFSGHSTLLDDRDLELSDYYVVTLSERQLDPDRLTRLAQRGSIVHTVPIGNVTAAWVLINDRAEKQAAQLAQADPAADAVVTPIELPVTRQYRGAAQHVILPRAITPLQIEQTLNDLSTRYRRLWFAWSTAASPVVQAQLRRWLAQTATLAQTADFGATQIAAYDLKPNQLGRLEPLRVQFNGNFALLGVDAASRQRNAEVTLRWQSLASHRAPYSVTLQLIDASGEVWNAGGGLIEDQDQFPSPRWPIGQVSDQVLSVNLPDEAPPGAYGVRVSVDQSDGQRVGLFSAGGTFSGTAPTLAEVDLPALDQPLDTLHRPVEYPFAHSWANQIEVLGFDRGPGVVINGDLWTVDVLWRSRTAGLPDLGVVWEVRDQANQKMFSTRLPLSPYPTSRWRAGDIIGAHYTLRFPVELTAADYQVFLGVTTPDGALLGDGLFKPFDVRLLARERSFMRPIIPALAVIFSDPAITLIGAQFPTGPQRPGAPLPITLYWRAGTTTDNFYTVFVRLESLTGQVLARIDSAPQGGGMPTISWDTDQIIEDVYPLTIPPETPPGAYRVVVGLYNPLDGTHLLDTATGRDEIVLSSLVVK
jgi:4-amino-4-deoxy-L-arabinose transferase-like glycosyltransferase